MDEHKRRRDDGLAQPILIETLQNPSLYPYPVKRFHVIQTHISWVLLTGLYAYKIKKPVNLGFLDFSTLEKRHFYCAEELRLNKRLAPQLYMDVVRITGSLDQPEFNGPGPAIEYAVRMKEFPQKAQLDRVLARGMLHRKHLDSLAQQLAEFHQRIGAARKDSLFGSPEQVQRPVEDNFKVIHEQLGIQGEPQRLGRLEAWMEGIYRVHLTDFEIRKRNGFIRECHGDMHLANMVLFKGQVVVFDCVEFNENFRWVDVMSETAFLVMDLEGRGEPECARHVLNAYLEWTGDYEGLKVLRYYRVYRALVRAKVACIRMSQPDVNDKEQRVIWDQYQSYVALAERYTEGPNVWLAITHGFSGAGKTKIAKFLVEATGALCVRTDVERKRLRGVSPNVRMDSGINAGLYTPEISRDTYARMAELAKIIIEAGFPVILDGAFLMRGQRDVLHVVAQQLRVPFIILDVHAAERTLRERIVKREREGRDVSEANLNVLEHQMAIHEPLRADESVFALSVKAEADLRRVVTNLKKMVQS